MPDVDRISRGLEAMSPHDNDSRPVPPTRPGPEDCCKGSCDPCIFDLYEDALDRYRANLKRWEERQARQEKEGPCAPKQSGTP